MRSDFSNMAIGVVVLIVVACAGGQGPAATPLASSGPTATPAALTTSPAPTSGPSTTEAGPSASSEGPLSEVELQSITLGALVPLPADALAPTIDAAAAEAIVRAQYGGDRVTIEVRRIAMRLQARTRVGWVVALTPAAGAACALHPGLLDRAIEGGIVDDQTGDMFWTMTCG